MCVTGRFYPFDDKSVQSVNIIAPVFYEINWLFYGFEYEKARDKACFLLKWSAFSF